MENTKRNYWLAILASIGFALIGALVYGFLYFWGEVAFLGTYVMFILASIGYKKVGKISKLDKKDYVILSVICALISIVTMFSVKTIAVANSLDIGFFQAMTNTFELISQPEMTFEFVYDIIWAIAFVIVGAVTMYIYEKKRAERQTETQTSNKTQQELNVEQDVQTNQEQNSETVKETPQSEESVSTTQNIECEYCKTQNDSKSAFCTNCGKELKK